MNVYRTPLHCAVAYSNLVVTRYLVEHGASLFLTTKEGDTPLHIAEEEHKLVRMGQQDGGSTGQDGTLEAATKCLDYLKGMWCGRAAILTFMHIAARLH